MPRSPAVLPRRRPGPREDNAAESRDPGDLRRAYAWHLAAWVGLVALEDAPRPWRRTLEVARPGFQVLVWYQGLVLLAGWAGGAAGGAAVTYWLGGAAFSGGVGASGLPCVAAGLASGAAAVIPVISRRALSRRLGLRVRE